MTKSIVNSKKCCNFAVVFECKHNNKEKQNITIWKQSIIYRPLNGQ